MQNTETIEQLELGQKYEIELRGRKTEVVLLAYKEPDEDVLWSASSRAAVLLKLPTGRQISRHPSALMPLKDQLDLYTERFDESTEEVTD